MDSEKKTKGRKKMKYWKGKQRNRKNKQENEQK